MCREKRRGGGIASSSADQCQRILGPINLIWRTKQNTQKISHINVFAQQNEKKSKAKLIQLALTAPTHNKGKTGREGGEAGESDAMFYLLNI